MDLTKLNETELKALAYENIVELERVQNNIRLINVEITKKLRDRMKAPEKVEEDGNSKK